MKSRIFKNPLTRGEMREIKGGIQNYLAPPPEAGDCKSECDPFGPNTCKTSDCPNSYCATYHCGPSNIRIHNCQYQ